jgi:hypothetical protein
MQWNDMVDWATSSAGERVLLGAVIPFIAIVIGAVVAALIARGAIKRLLRDRDREAKASAVATLIDAAGQASNWNSLNPQEQAIADRTATTADIHLRLLPIAGAATAANWAGHEISQFKRASATYSVQFDGPLAEFRDRLLDWQKHPRRARKIFESDLSRWEAEMSREQGELQAQQDAWVAQQHSERYGSPTAKTTPSPAPQAARPAAAAPTIQPAQAPAPRIASPLESEARTPTTALGTVQQPSDGGEPFVPVPASARARQVATTD